jgi:long-chain fatty acid transport protein
MRRRGASKWKALGAMAAGAALAAAGAHPGLAAGFSIYEQSAQATGMGDAVIAQSSDPSVIFFNPGGMAFFSRAAGSVGDTYITETRASFTGANPFPGVGENGSEHRLQVFPPHAYYIQPITSTFQVGIGLETPFGLTTQWSNPDTFSGRYLSTYASIHDIDVNPTVSFQLSPNFGIGIGAIIRGSNVTLERDVPGVDPFTFQVDNVAKVKLHSNNDYGFGGDIGLLYKTETWSLGATYRSQINVNYSGSAVLFPRTSGDPAFDQLVAATTPFNTAIPVKTAIKYPGTGGVGASYKLMPSLTLEVDGNWFGWSRFDQVGIEFPGGQLPNETIVERWKDSYAVRGGLEWASSASWKWRLGYVFDQTPQPTQTVNPLLPDANRNGVTIGAGWSGQHFTADLGIMYLFFADRSRNSTFDDDTLGPFYGTYSTRALLISLDLGFRQ